MKPYNESEELKKFAAMTAGRNAADTARNEQLIARFRKTEFDPQNRIKNRIRLKLSGRDDKKNAKYPLGCKLAALAACLLILAVLYRPHKSNARRADIPPDYYAYYNFPSTGHEAMLRLKKTPPDWLDHHRFPALQYAGKI